MTMKTCSKCGLEKEATLGNFHKSSASKDGLRNECKECRSTAGRANIFTAKPASVIKNVTIGNVKPEEEKAMSDNLTEKEVEFTETVDEAVTETVPETVETETVSEETKETPVTEKVVPVEVVTMEIIDAWLVENSRLTKAQRDWLNEQGLKYCNRCKQIHEKSNYHNDKTKEDGCMSWCKTCVKAHREKVKAAKMVERESLKFMESEPAATDTETDES